MEIILNSNITDMYGEGRLEGIEVTNNDGKKRNIDISCLFEEIGRSVDASFLEGIEKDPSGFIQVNSNFETNIDGIYVAGDNRVKEVRQLVTAVSDGAVAATQAIKYINNLK